MNYLERLGVWLRQILRDFPEEIVQRIMQQIADSWRPQRLLLSPYEMNPPQYYKFGRRFNEEKRTTIRQSNDLAGYKDYERRRYTQLLRQMGLWT